MIGETERIFMHKVATSITEYLIANGVAQRDMREKYIYGLEVFGLKCLNYGTILLMAVLLKTLIPTLFFLICFFSLRGRTGGFHSKSGAICYVGTTVIYMGISKIVAPFLASNIIITAFTIIISYLVIIILAPLNNKNLQLNKEELLSCKKSTHILLLLIIGCLGVACYIQVNTVCIAFAICGVALDAVLLFIQKIMERREQHEEEYGEKRSASDNC